MAIMNDILSMVRKGKQVAQDLDEIKKYNTQSIAKRASDATLQFPCLITNTVAIDKATAITNNMDRVYAAFVQTVVASNPMIDISVYRGPIDYIKKIHQNLKMESAIDFDALEESCKGKDDVLRNMMETEFPEFVVSESVYDEVMSQAYKGEYRLFLNPERTFGIAFKESAISGDAMKSHRNGLVEHMSEFNLSPMYIKEDEDETITNSEILNNYIDGANNRARLDSFKNSDKMSVSPKMVDRDVKKANDMQPYGIQVRLLAVNDQKQFVQSIDFIVGIKTILHPIKSEEMISNVSYALQNRNAVFNFIRWTTGEISLWKDLLLHLDELKFDVNYKDRGMSPFFPALKRLKDKKVEFGTFGVRKLVPNATLVISTFELDEIRKRTGVDLHDVHFAKKLIQQLFLLTFIIVDEGSETIEILYESSSAFETYALETLEREISMNSNKLGKEIGRMISK